MKLTLILLATFLVAVVYAEYSDEGYGPKAHSAKGYGESRGYGVYRHRPRSRRGHRIIRPGSSWHHSGGYTKTTKGRTDEKRKCLLLCLLCFLLIFIQNMFIWIWQIFALMDLFHMELCLSEKSENQLLENSLVFPSTVAKFSKSEKELSFNN